MVLMMDSSDDSQPVSADTVNTFNFPLIDCDGLSSVSEHRQPTPPAALSSLGAKMAEHSESNSFSLLDDAYDMVDDISELSSDDHETVSIASTSNREEDDQELEYDTDAAEQVEIPNHTISQHLLDQPSVTLNPTDAHTRSLSQDQAFKVRLPFHDGLAASTSQAQSYMLDSTHDDFETPRQSTITAKLPTVDDSVILTESQAAKDEPLKPLTLSASTYRTLTQNRYLIAVAGLLPLHVGTWLAIACLVWACLGPISLDTLTPTNSTSRISELHESLHHFTGSESVIKHVNYTHLVPDTSVIGSTMFGLPIYGTKDIRYQAVAGNHLIISLPQVKLATYPKPISLIVQRDAQDLPANQTRLLDGVYVVSLEPGDAYGLVSVSMACKGPKLAVSIAHDFGSRLLHLNTYEKACTDISKALAKDVAVARVAAEVVGHNIQHDLESKLRLASSKLHSTTRELTVLADKATKSLLEVEKVGIHLADDIGKDLVAAGKEIQSIFKTTFDNVKMLIPNATTIKEPILISRDRALIIREKLFRFGRFSRFNKTRATTAKSTVRSVKADTKALSRKHHQTDLSTHAKQGCKKSRSKGVAARRPV